MKLFYGVMMLVLVGALALPFFLKGPSGEPIMSVDGAITDAINDTKSGGRSGTDVSSGTPTEMYRWQDEHGVWQFGEQPPAHLQAVSTAESQEISPQVWKVAVDHSRTNTMGREWVIEPVVSAARVGGNADSFQMPNSLTDAYRAAPELMGAAKRAATSMNDRQADMDDLLEQLKSQAGDR